VTVGVLFHVEHFDMIMYTINRHLNGDVSKSVAGNSRRYQTLPAKRSLHACGEYAPAIIAIAATSTDKATSME
jgi:hypothetical protein